MSKTETNPSILFKIDDTENGFQVTVTSNSEFFKTDIINKQKNQIKLLKKIVIVVRKT